MKIVIFAGGSGSAELQEGLRNHGVHDVHVITNLLDNGLSTGDVRRVYNNKIAGPSDLRKNQIRMSTKPDIRKFLYKRINGTPSYVNQYLLKHNEIFGEHSKIIVEAIKHYFLQPLSREIKYNSFSVANIIYAGLAGTHNNSLIEAGNIMAEVLGIPVDYVVPISDESVYLHAITQSNHVIFDEADIVEWNNPVDKIKAIMLKDSGNNMVEPKADKRALDLIEQADIIIYSSGTQWSSLLPTYMYEGVVESINKSSAKQYFVLNLREDKDMKNVPITDLVYHSAGYKLPLDHITFISDKNNEYHKNFALSSLEYSSGMRTTANVHDGHILAKLILKNYYEPYINEILVFDYDNTLDGKCIQKLRKLEDYIIYICTGNGVKHIHNFEGFVYAERGANLYHVSARDGANLLNANSKYQFTSTEIDDILIQLVEDIGFNINNIDVRGDAIIAIKPIFPEYRKIIRNFLSKILSPEYLIENAGKTTVEISKLGLNKTIILDDFGSEIITYVGDEPNGNDAEIMKHQNVRPLKVRSPKDTRIFLNIL